METSNDKNYKLDIGVLSTQIRFLEGEILTIIDAVFGQPEQNKAIKDIIKLSFRRKQNHLAELASGELGACIEAGQVAIPVKNIAR